MFIVFLFGFIDLTFLLVYCFPACGKLPCGKLFHGDGRKNDGRFPAIGGFNLFLGISRDCDKFIRALGGVVIGFFETRKSGLKDKASERVQNPEAWIGKIILFKTPVILGRNVTITEVKSISLFDGFGLGASDGNDKVVIREIKVIEVALAEWTKKTAEASWKDLKPANVN